VFVVDAVDICVSSRTNTPVGAEKNAAAVVNGMLSPH